MRIQATHKMQRAHCYEVHCMVDKRSNASHELLVQDALTNLSSYPPYEPP